MINLSTLQVGQQIYRGDSLVTVRAFDIEDGSISGVDDCGMCYSRVPVNQFRTIAEKEIQDASITRDTGETKNKKSRGSKQPVRFRLCSAEMFVGEIEDSGYSLQIYSTKNFVETVKAQYREWTGGEELPDNCLRIYPEVLGEHEWRVGYRYSPDMLTFLPIMVMGNGGSKARGGTPHALLRGTTAYIFFEKEIETLVRAGLRAQRHISGNYTG